MSLYYDGCFPDAPGILTEEEYFDKVIFDRALLYTFQFFHWIINDNRVISRMANLNKTSTGP